MKIKISTFSVLQFYDVMTDKTQTNHNFSAEHDFINDQTIPLFTPGFVLFFNYLLFFGPDDCGSRISSDRDVQTQFVSRHHHNGGLGGATHAVQVDLWRILENNPKGEKQGPVQV